MENLPNDRPLSGTANFMLLLAATATMLLFYLFVIGSILVLLTILLIELIVFVAAMRFGIGGVLIPVIKGHGQLCIAFCRSMKLGKPPGFRIALEKSDNPELHGTLKNICEKAGVPLPRTIYLEMGVNAWVQMKGFRRGSGTTALGIGYDLLAGLTRVEFEGVLAHEMMHAKLVERGFRQLLSGGIGRAAKLTNILAVHLAEGRRAKRSENLTAAFMRGADTLTRQAARQVAACSRQDEFAADRGAAEISSAGAIRSALLKLEGLNRIALRLNLRERVAQLESGEGFSEWLIEELSVTQPSAEAEVKIAAFNKYSTHPSLHDRLAALSIYPDQTLEESSSAIGLLAQPDDVAEKLVKVIQEQVIAQEETDSKKLTQWSRKTGASHQVQPKQMGGICVVIFGFVLSGCVAASYSGLLASVLAVLSLVGGVVLYRFGYYREDIFLPVPDYTLIKVAWQKKLDIKQDEISKMEEGLRDAILHERKRSGRESLLVKRSYEALETCDYVRAHVAARICLEVNNKSIPGALAFVVAAGYLRQRPQVTQALRFVIRSTGMRGPSQPWGAGWGLLLLGDWVHAEAFLEQARTGNPASATILALLAHSQARRGKLFSAIASARQAATMQPIEKEYAKLLIDLLLQGGFLREANEQLSQLQEQAATDPELMINMVKLGLMSKQVAVANQWAELAIDSPAGPHKFVKLGAAYEAARHDEKAKEFFRHALTLGHYPEALIGLGRLEIHHRNFEQARIHLLAALNLHLPVGEESANPVELVLPIFQQLKLLQDPVLDCRAWIVAMSQLMTPAALANVTLLIYAPTQAEAQGYLSAAVAAMQPNRQLPPVPKAMTWRAAPREQQPDGPVIPGIQGLAS